MGPETRSYVPPSGVPGCAACGCLSRTLKGDLHEATRRKLLLFRGGRHMQQLYEEACLLHMEWESLRNREEGNRTQPNTAIQYVDECKRWHDSEAEPAQKGEPSMATLRNAIIALKSNTIPGKEGNRPTHPGCARQNAGTFQRGHSRVYDRRG